MREIIWCLCLAVQTAIASEPCRIMESYDPTISNNGTLAWELMMHAPVVVVGVAGSVEAVGTPQQARRTGWDLQLQLTRVTVHVENWLRGEQPVDELQFYYFGLADRSGSVAGPPPFRVRPGDRRIYYLTHECGQFRSIGDFMDFTTAVESGVHPKVRPKSDADFGEAIADILLTLGDGYRGEAFSETLGWALPFVNLVATRKAVGVRLRTLTSVEDSGISTRACFYLSEQFNGQYGCLQRIAMDGSVAPESRAEAKVRLRRELKKVEKLKRVLPYWPFHTFTNLLNNDSVFEIQQELELPQYSPDSDLRRIACRCLVRYYPDPPASCSQQRDPHAGKARTR